LQLHFRNIKLTVATMTIPLEKKSTVNEIRGRFDGDVERFSNLDTGQQATIDAPVAMELITRAAAVSASNLRRVLDIGCGAGNNTLMLLQLISPLDCDLVDLSKPMLDRAFQRITKVNQGKLRILQGDFRELDLPNEHYDVIFAAAMLHHFRDDADWERAFEKIYSLTAPGGNVWITDMVCHEGDAVHAMMWERYGDYLTDLGGEEYRDKVFSYIDKEDSPRPVTYQLELLRRVGFIEVDILHKNSCFAAFGAKKKDG